jgi:hypothetical protein
MREGAARFGLLVHVSNDLSVRRPLHVPDTGAHIRQGLSHMFDAPIIPELSRKD